MAAYYDKQILDTVAASDRPLRHREIAERIAPGDGAAWNQIGNSLTHLYRAGLLARTKLDGHHWHYTAPALTDRARVAVLEAAIIADWAAWYRYDSDPLHQDVAPAHAASAALWALVGKEPAP